MSSGCDRNSIMASTTPVFSVGDAIRSRDVAVVVTQSQLPPPSENGGNNDAHDITTSTTTAPLDNSPLKSHQLFYLRQQTNPLRKVKSH